MFSGLKYQLISNISFAFSGYNSDNQMTLLIQLYHASGALTNGIIPKHVLSDQDALHFIKQDKPQLLDDSFISSSKALKWFHQIGQDQRLRFRPQGTERQQMTETQSVKLHNKLILHILKELGFLSDVIPPKPDVEALMILGAAQEGVKLRFDSAAQMISEKKINPKKIIIISGARDLWPVDTAGLMKGETSTLDILEQCICKTNKIKGIREIIQSKFDSRFDQVGPKNGAQVKKARADIANSISKEYNVKWPTEADMMNHLVHKHPVLNEFEIIIINAPKIRVKYGDEYVLERPNTKSTLEETVRQYGGKLMFKDVVIMSSQPHCKYQQGVVEGVVGQLCNIHMAAPGINLKSTLSEEKIVMSGLEGVYSSVYSYKDRATELLKEQEEQTYNTRWQDYIRERRNVKSELQVFAFN